MLPGVSPRARPLPAGQRRASIIAAARSLLISTGITFTTRQVADSAGIAEGTIFRAFGSKSELLEAVIDDILDPTDLCAQIVALPAERPMVETVSAVIRLLHKGIGTTSAVFAALHHVAADGDEPPKKAHSAPIHRERAEKLQQAIATVLQPYAAQIRIPAAQAAAMVRSTAFATAHPFFSDPQVSDPATIADLLVNGLYVHSNGTPCSPN